MTTDSADCALSQPSPETSATGALTDIQLWELLPKRLEQNLLAMVQIAAPHHNLRPVDLLQNIAPDFVDYARAVLKAKPQAERPSEKDLYDLAAEFNGDPVPAMRRALELWGNPLQGAPAPGENLATPPAPAAPVDAGSVADALIQAESALADVAEGESGAHRLSDRLQWTETRCTEALAAIRPVMRRHGIRTSDLAPAPTPPPADPAERLVESIARIIASDSSEGPESFQGISKDVIHGIAAWLDTQGHQSGANAVRRELCR